MLLARLRARAEAFQAVRTPEPPMTGLFVFLTVIVLLAVGALAAFGAWVIAEMWAGGMLGP